MTGRGGRDRLLRQALDAYRAGRSDEAMRRLGEAAAVEEAGEGAGEPAPGDRPFAGTYEVRLLGVPRVAFRPPVEGAGGDAVELSWRLRRSFELFAYLAASPELRARREELVAAGWPEEEEAVVRRNFHPTLSHLRRALAVPATDPPPLELDSGVYRLSPGYRWRIDVHRIAGLAREAERRQGENPRAAIAAWEEAWRLYRGPFLEGFYASWAIERRERVNRLYLQVLRRLGRAYGESGEPERALDAYRAVLAVDPLSERIHLEVIRLYAQLGRRDLVRRQYDHLTALLRRELGVEPMPETAADYHRLMR